MEYLERGEVTERVSWSKMEMRIISYICISIFVYNSTIQLHLQGVQKKGGLVFRARFEVFRGFK